MLNKDLYYNLPPKYFLIFPTVPAVPALNTENIIVKTKSNSKLVFQNCLPEHFGSLVGGACRHIPND